MPSLSVPQCPNCGEISIDHLAGEQIDLAFREAAGLLSAEAIRTGRQRLQLTQQQMADRLGIAVATLSRWETGAQVQQRFHDRMLRAFFELPIFREYLTTFAIQPQLAN